MEFRTLENTPVQEIITAFNEAFSDYFIRLQLSLETMASKMKAENILLPYSVGAFENEKLAGFILHGYDVIDGVKTIYNAGTGVIPSFRGKSVTAAMYRFVIPLLQQQDIHTHVLEVIDNNFPAIKIYNEVGFEIVRYLAAFKSTNAIEKLNDIEVIQIKPVKEEVKPFASMVPAWQNSLASIERDKESHQFFGVYKANRLIAYAAYVPSTGRVKQCAVHPDHRRKGIGRALFYHMQQNSGMGELLVTNIDVVYKPAVSFFNALGFEKLLGLHEMKLDLINHR